MNASETDRMINQIRDTDYSSYNSHDSKDAVQLAPQWGSDAPDGGIVAWGVILGLWCTSFCSFGWLSSTFPLSVHGAVITPSGVGVFQEYYENTLLRGYSSSTISWIPSLQFFLMMGMVRFSFPHTLRYVVSFVRLVHTPVIAYVHADATCDIHRFGLCRNCTC